MSKTIPQADWQRIEVLFDEAVKLSGEKREKFLRAISEQKPGLYQELVSLLEADAATHPLLDGHVIQVLEADSDLSMQGKQIGPYRIVRLLGAGGMGDVYLAERVKGDFDQRVALKLIKRGMDSQDILQRFRSERQILAQLQHPNIAHLLDGGLSEDGQPYFAMEYVDGQPIDAYCDAKRLTIAERLHLFLTVCQAVQYAHRTLVVHRDLKPANILVTQDDSVKLVDFGIAKMIADGGSLLPGLPALTRTGQHIMTPEYASPEQIQGAPLTTASDVYALGVVLYELLTGMRPFDFSHKRSPAEIDRIISTTDVERPSTRLRRLDRDARQVEPHRDLATVCANRATQPQRLRKQLNGDLDNICLMALRKEPERRYSSVAQFAEDLQRYLSGQPVLARADTFSYRLQKFVRRHRTGVSIAVSAVLLITALTGFYTHQLASERDKARLEAQKAEQVSQFLQDLFELSDPSQAKGNEITAREILDEGAERIERELADQPEVQAEMMNVIGMVYESLGLFDEAETMVARALALRQTLYQPGHPDVNESLSDLGVIKKEQGEYQAAAAIHREVLAVRRQKLGDMNPKTIQSLQDLADVHYQAGEYDSAGVIYAEVLPARRELFGPKHESVAESSENLATVRHAQGRYAEADSLYRQASALHKLVYGEESRQLATNLSNRANLARVMGNWDEAEKLQRQALAMRRKILGENHPDYTSSLNNLAVLLREKGDLDGAAEMYREAIAVRRKMLGANHPTVAVPLTGLASVLQAQGNLQEAEKLFLESLQLHRQTLPAKHPNIAHPLIGLARVLMQRGQSARAEPYLREALQLRKNGLPEGHWRTAQAESILAECLASLSKFQEAESLILPSLTLMRKSFGDEDIRTKNVLQRVYAMYEKWGRADKASEYAQYVQK